MKYFLAVLLFAFPAYAGIFDNYDECKIIPHYSPNQNAEVTIVQLIDQTKTVLHVEAYQLTSKPIIEAMRKARSRGVEVKALLDKSQRPNEFPFETRVAYRYKLMHNKVMIFDNAVLISGSYNFTKNAEKYNAENFDIKFDCKGDYIKRYEREFQTLWASSK